MTATMPAAYVDAFFDFYVAVSLDESVALTTFEDLTGRPPRAFEQWARVHAGPSPGPLPKGPRRDRDHRFEGFR
jgi:hypothetical protein